MLTTNIVTKHRVSKCLITVIPNYGGGREGAVLNASVNYSIIVDYTFPLAIKKLGNDIVTVLLR